MDRNGTAHRVFGFHDQETFGAISGDCNPIHVDVVAARRTIFGQVAVHGVHLLLWGLDSIWASLRRPLALATLRANFDAFVAPGTEVRLSWELEGTTLRAKISRDMTIVARFRGEIAERPLLPWTGKTDIDAVSCVDVALEDIVDRQGETPLNLPPSWPPSFPALARDFPPEQVATLLASTRIVGMLCPGRHSIFSGLQLSFSGGGNVAASLRYRVARFDSRVSLVEMTVAGQGVSGSLSTFRRPAPVAQQSFDDLAELVASDEFAAQTALVVGGSRGIGETTAKLLALGGGNVTLTYAVGKLDAERIVQAGSDRGLRMAARELDMRNPQFSGLAGPFTNVYYCASPWIPSSRLGCFDPSQFESLVDIYLVGLARLAAWLSSTVKEICTLWIPSTQFLEDGQPEFGEYVAAKACLETLCLQLSGLLPNIHMIAQRLPRVASDQTQALTPVSVASTAQTVLGALRHVSMEGRSRSS